MLEKYMFTKVNQFLNGSLDGEIKSVIKKKAIIAAIFMALPIPVVGTIGYIWCLWTTYSKVAEISTVPFKDNLWSNISGAVVINIILALVSEGLCYVFGIGTLMLLLLGYASITISGMAYVKALKIMYKDRARVDLDIQGGLKNVKENPTSLDKTFKLLND